MGEFEKRKTRLILGLEEPKKIMDFFDIFPSITPMIPIDLELLQKQVNKQSEWERKFRKEIGECRRDFPIESTILKDHPDWEAKRDTNWQFFDHLIFMALKKEREKWFEEWFMNDKEK